MSDVCNLYSILEKWVDFVLFLCCSAPEILVERPRNGGEATEWSDWREDQNKNQAGLA